MGKRLLALAALLAAVTMLAAPAAAPASQVSGSDNLTYTFSGGTRVSDNPRYAGWARVDPNHCPAGQVCAMVYRFEAPAWQWRGYWRQRTVRTGTWVYVWPYTAGWSWAWTAERGWLAMHSTHLVYGGSVAVYRQR